VNKAPLSSSSLSLGFSLFAGSKKHHHRDKDE
jgi:hypothetical protein